MATKVLGVSAFYHDSAAALVVDGITVAALEEERVTRRKHDARLPIYAIQYCLEEARVDPQDLDAIAFYDDAVLTWDRIVRSAASVGEQARSQFREAARRVLGDKIWVEAQIERHLGSLGKAGRVSIVPHHMSHAASAFYPSPFHEAAVIVADGVGEWATTSIGRGHGPDVEPLEEIRYPHSLGLLYSAFTQLCGFRVNDGEYKLMGLAPYGTPRFAARILDEVVDVRADGSFRLDCALFDFMKGSRMVSERLEALFEGPCRAPDALITRREEDIAASVQQVLQEILLRLARHAKAVTGAENVVLAGGVALNCVANGVLRRSGVFERVWIQPAASDAGGAIGAALAVSHQRCNVPRPRPRRDTQHGSRLGPRFEPREVRAFLDRHDISYEVTADRESRAERIAEALASGKVVGLFAGRMEIGPRALGARSILADPRDPGMQERINALVKRRESFRPFAPAVLRERAADYFEIEGESPYMLVVAPVRKARTASLPATTHVDGSARIQTVDDERYPELAAVLRAFERRTGCPVLLNTSFNVKDEPIVGTPRAAFECFEKAGLDLLALEDCLILRREAAGAPTPDDVPALRATLAEASLIRAQLQARDREQRTTYAAAVADDLFDVLLPLHTDATSSELPLRPDPEQTSYFSEAGGDGGVVEGPRTAEDLAARLATLWSDLPSVHGLEAATACARAAMTLRAQQAADETTPGAGLYVMF